MNKLPIMGFLRILGKTQLEPNMTNTSYDKALETLLLNSYRLRSLIDDLNQRSKSLDKVKKAA